MSGGDTTRLVAWAQELRRVHHRLREALRVTRRAVSDGSPAHPAARELLLFCHGFCTALTGHHEGEDRALFPAITERHPQLTETIRKLEADHSMIAYLLTALQDAVDRAAPPEELDRHLEGVAAIMESHFRYEERVLLAVLDTLDLDADPQDVLGPL
ncbi:hemerythrin domain-containing protein [Myceligenerans pegani]|uniref:Hemerythrin domain-containing protein n=1 Tax=Myceligenerans pegani TaxID=2776917 RepID=A0ABR9MXT3_9MICO|nr:hemerythrin domain-containing protein [Myceligenerans sp. TRM 65318]MBE1876209.1 hemerythrin domain-containing protein [Myceligenerans sp. TRM 65318]MBE3018480.1 hemerythrin domain-containing protein [Myceligenerans sp. TRM 65318]